MNRAWAILAGVCGLLAVAALAPWLRGILPAAPAARSPASAAADGGEAFNDPAPLESYTEILRRPVFLAARRPAEAAKSAAAQPRLLGRYIVAGVVIAGARRIVLLRRAEGDRVSRIEQGAELDGWTLAEVSRQRLVLEKAGQRQEFSLQPEAAGAD